MKPYRIIISSKFEEFVPIFEQEKMEYIILEDSTKLDYYTSFPINKHFILLKECNDTVIEIAQKNNYKIEYSNIKPKLDLELYRRCNVNNGNYFIIGDLHS